MHKDFSNADLLLIVVATIWGVNVAVVKSALTEFNPLTFNSLRFGVSALLSWGMLGLRGEKMLPRRKDLGSLVVLGLLGHAFYQVLFISGTNLTTAANTALLLATIPVWVAALGAITREEMAGPLTWTGIGMSVLGIALVTASGDFSLGGGTWVGDIMLVGGTFFLCPLYIKEQSPAGKIFPLAIFCLDNDSRRCCHDPGLLQANLSSGLARTWFCKLGRPCLFGGAGNFSGQLLLE